MPEPTTYDTPPPASETALEAAGRGGPVPVAATVALLPWGDLIDDFLDTIGVSLETFCTRMTGGWFFGYIDALRHAGMRTAVICFSARVDAPRTYHHGPTDAVFAVLPPSRVYRALRTKMQDPYGTSTERVFGRHRGVRRWGYGLLRHVAPYLATPPLRLARALRQQRCGAVLCQEYEYARFDVCVAVGRLLGIPVYATFQGGTWQASRLEHVLRPVALKACAGLIVAPRAEAGRLRETYGLGGEKVARIFNPLDLSTWTVWPSTAVRAALGVPAEARVVVWHGRVEMHRKGLDVLLEAWARLCQACGGVDLRLWLIGTGRDAARLQEQIRERRLTNLWVIDEYILDRVRLNRYLCAADVYVLPSRHEGFPVAPLEAMASGLPVVATDVHGIADILEGGDLDGGIIVPREDAGALAGALEELLTCPERRRRMGTRARQRVVRTFSVPAVGEQLRSLLAGPAALPPVTPPAPFS